MSKNKNEANVLDEINKGACMGMDAISFIMDKVKDEKLKEELDVQYNKYKEISDEICKLYPEYSKKEPHETNAMAKMMSWYGIQMRTITDDTTSKLSELLMQGTNMGIIEGRRLLNDKKMDKDVHRIVQKYVEMQEAAVENLKRFL